MHLAQDRIQWQAVVNTVMNLGVPQRTVSGYKLLKNLVLWSCTKICIANLILVRATVI